MTSDVDAREVIRIGHLGDLNEGMCLTALSLAELSLAAAGARIAFGSGGAAAQTCYAGNAPSARMNIAAE
ncbi:hypothetical protein [Rhodovulum sp.]|uniref:hypothetical protein n=1 Tax=Rhodovulum sp. TaxID=34009 RepID=UPI00257DB581|nr:hypothetical protein [Rhodovulum sp.]